jgi:hypothetical protein
MSMVVHLHEYIARRFIAADQQRHGYVLLHGLGERLAASLSPWQQQRLLADASRLMGLSVTSLEDALFDVLILVQWSLVCQEDGSAPGFRVDLTQGGTLFPPREEGFSASSAVSAGQPAQ